MAEAIAGSKELMQAFKAIADHHKPVEVHVGYTANYALHVHENLSMPHSNGQAKFLEQPAREMANDVGKLTVAAVKNGATLEQGLIIGGMSLQRASMKLVPVDTGNLKNSAFTRKA